MTSSPRPLVRSLALLALLTSLALADVPMARRLIGFAKEYIDKKDVGRVNDARNYLNQAEAALSNVPDAEKTPILAEIRQLRVAADDYEREYNVHNADTMLQREFDQLKAAAEGKDPRSHLTQVDQIEPMFVRMGNLMKYEICTKNFSPEHMAEWQAKVDALRGVAMRTTFDNIVKDIEETLQKVEERNADTSDRRYSEETYEGYLARAEEWRQRLPDTDDRKEQLRQRQVAAKSARARRLAGNAKEAVVNAFREHWARTKEQYEGNWQGWERENAFEFSQWWREHGQMHLDKCEARWEMAQRATEDDRWKEGVAQFPDDPRVKAITTEVAGIADETAKKYCEAANRMLEGAEGKLKEDCSGVKDRVTRLTEKLVQYAPSTPGGAAVLARAQALLNRIHEIEVNGSDPGTSAPPTPSGTTPSGTAPSGTTPSGTTPSASPATPEPSGGGVSFLSLFLGCACCFGLLAVVGGGAFFVMKQQKGAAPSGAAPGAPPKA